MKIAAFDTSSNSGSIALLEDRRLICELTVAFVAAHSQWLMPRFDELLKRSGWPIEEIGLFAVTTGPGSFTGLRIGLSAVKGLAYAMNKEVIAVSTLKALALNYRYSRFPVCPVLDARKQEVYSALYGWEGESIVELIKECVSPPDELFSRIKSLGLSTPVIFLGNGLKVYEKAIRDNVQPAIIAPEPLMYVKAVNVGLSAYEDIASAVRPSRLTPAYLRKSEAELKNKPA
ncbi:MAG: tRNA (adenosine(37)-N6)-threonylcarbamoyltransferase complex dimerization subunit type 1 TsaB [Deltaproteobacteria bacterium]|nr:tRNA (adenosine(37)-N6)-threonylcarbamoyltransferase complex dimerization subunit type 1 TsaB [Deltaproteobacteria bacterium]